MQVRVRARTADEYAGQRRPARRSGRPLATAVALATVLSLAAAGCTSGADAPPRQPGRPVGHARADADLRRLRPEGPDRRAPGGRRQLQLDLRRQRRQDPCVRRPRQPGRRRQVARARCPTCSWSRAVTWPGCRRKRLSQPIDELLDERGVDFGDGYSRDALAAFSADNRLQCMPYGDLADGHLLQQGAHRLRQDDPARARRPRHQPRATPAGASSSSPPRPSSPRVPRTGTRGVYVDPTLRGLAPFIYSGGGAMFDDEESPTSLAFSDDDTRRRARAHPGAAARPAPHADREAARQGARR